MAKEFGIQRVAQGLQGLLNFFGGYTPAEMLPDVRAVVELGDFYGADLFATATTGPIAVQAINAVASLPVPSNETWRMLAVHAALDLAAAAVGAAGAAVEVTFIPRGQIGAVALGFAELVNLNANAKAIVALSYFSRPFIALSGSKFDGFNLVGLPAAGSTLTVTAAFQRIRS